MGSIGPDTVTAYPIVVGTTTPNSESPWSCSNLTSYLSPLAQSREGASNLDKVNTFGGQSEPPTYRRKALVWRPPGLSPCGLHTKVLSNVWWPVYGSLDEPIRMRRRWLSG